MNLSHEELTRIRDLGPEQAKALIQKMAGDAWEASGRRSSFEGATGVGKTKVAIDKVKEQFARDANSLIYITVPTETLRDVEWPEEFVKWGAEDLLPKVKLICHASIHKEKPERDVDLWIFDEIHHMTPQSASFCSSDNWKVFYILGLSALVPKENTRYEDDQHKAALINAIAPSCFKVTLEEATFLRLVSEFEVMVCLFELDTVDRYVLGGTKKKPCMMTEKGQYHYLTKQLQRATFSKAEGADAFKFVWIQKRTQFLYNLRTRHRIAEDIWTRIKDDGKTLLFFGSIEAAEKLCGENVYHSKTNDTKLIAFQKDEISYLGAVGSLNEGKNIPLLDQALVTQLNSKEQGIIQRIGRIVRYREGHVARIIILVAKGTADEKWFKSATENFNQARIKKFNVKPLPRDAKGIVTVPTG